MSNLSPSTLALLRAAKNDAPSKESRNAIWGGVTSGLVTHTPLHITPQASAGSTGVNAGANVGASIAPQAAAAAATAKGGLLVTSSLTGMKGAFIGALFGSALSIGVATFMLRAKPADVPRAPLSAQAATTQVGDSSKANESNSVSASTTQASSTNASASTTDVQELDALLPNDPSSATSPKSGSSQNSGTSAIAGATKSSSSNAKSMTDETQSLRSKKSATPTSDLSPEDMLSREVSLVQEARRDLQNGDAASALKTVRAARSLEARQLEPEEMSLEAKALHLLGRHLEAAKIESQRRAMYPNAL
jgi:hypothetical protein